jgi:uncharacterized protein (TIGR02246 family)
MVTEEIIGGPASVAGALLAAVNAADVDGVLACWAPDGVMCPPHHPAVRGHDAIAAYFRKVFATRRLTFRFTDSHVAAVDGLAVERLAYTAVAVALEGGAEVRDTGKGLHVYHRAPDGRWLITHDIWNSDLAP